MPIRSTTSAQLGRSRRHRLVDQRAPPGRGTKPRQIVVPAHVIDVVVAKLDAKVAGRAEDVLTVLDARGIAVSAEQRARVLDCTDALNLDRWLRRAVTVATTEELFTD